LVAIIVHPSAPVYSFQVRRTTVEDAAGTATPATTSMPRQRLRSIRNLAYYRAGRDGGDQRFDGDSRIHGTIRRSKHICSQKKSCR
jgi:hypothetical protein